MLEPDPLVAAALAAHEDGHFDEALRLLQQLFTEEECAVDADRSRLFITMFGWKMLAEAYPPARAALQALRDTQVGQLLAGDLYFGPPRGPVFDDGSTMQKTRFAIVVEIDRMIDEPASTAALFARLDADAPALAQRYAHAALPAVVATGQFALADRYRGDPLRHLDAINREALVFPLLPAVREAPRLAAGLSGLVSNVAIGIAVLEGLGQPGKAVDLRAALLAGLHDGALRDLAARELAASGTITRTILDHQTALEAKAADQSLLLS